MAQLGSLLRAVHPGVGVVLVSLLGLGSFSKLTRWLAGGRNHFPAGVGLIEASLFKTSGGRAGRGGKSSPSFFFFF